MGVDVRCQRDIGVAHKILGRPDIDAALCQIRAIGMPQAVGHQIRRQGKRRDKASGGRESQKLVLAILEKPILDPCRRGAAIYNCAITPEYARRNLAEVGTGAVSTTLYATAGLALEAAFAKTTLRSMQSLLRGVTAKLSSSLGTGAACAAADGPLPIGDALGVTLAIGGTVFSLHDLRAVQSKLPDALATALRHSVEEYWNSCRLEAIR